MKKIFFSRILFLLVFPALMITSTLNAQKTMTDFGIRASNLFLYYEDLDRATEFYTNTLGMELMADYQMARIIRMAGDSYLILVDATKGMHTAEEPKTVALALLTDQLDEWWEYLKTQDIEIKYDFKPKEGSPHDGFVAIDPEGYLLEFERFNKHAENENFIPILDQNETIIKPDSQKSNVPKGLGFKATITWLYYKDLLAAQKFYQDDLGLPLVADQGWTKIHKVTNTGFIGLVDEKKGMHNFTETKAVNVSFILDDLEPWFKYVKENELFKLRSDKVETGPETKYKAFVGYDPEGYYLEFDRFYKHPDNDRLMSCLEDKNIKSELRTALLLIDIQNFYFPGAGPGLVGAEEASIAAKEILQSFRDKNQLVIHVRHQSSKGFEIHDNVKPLSNEKIVTKNEVNCFNGTDLLEYLENQKVYRLVIVGMQTQMCLEAAVRAGHDYGFKCLVIEDACATRDLKYGETVIKAEAVHASTLATIRDGGYAEVIDMKAFREIKNNYLFKRK